MPEPLEKILSWVSLAMLVHSLILWTLRNLKFDKLKILVLLHLLSCMIFITLSRIPISKFIRTELEVLGVYHLLAGFDKLSRTMPTPLTPSHLLMLAYFTSSKKEFRDMIDRVGEWYIKHAEKKGIIIDFHDTARE